MELVEILTRLGGVASTAELVAVSSRRKVRSALGRGEVVRVGRDRLALPAREHGVRAARALNGYLSHASAALHHGWEIWSQPDLPRVMLPRGRTVPHELPELAEIGVRHLPSSDRDGWATSYLRTVLDCARDLPFVEALAVADSALRSGDLMVDNLEAAAARLTRAGDARVRRVLLLADLRAANPFESALRALAIQSGLDVIPQYETGAASRAGSCCGSRGTRSGTIPTP